MKPNRFIINSDYLALAQTSEHSASLTFPKTAHDLVFYDPRDPNYALFSPVARVVRTISAPAVRGAIEQAQITYGGVTYAGNELLYPVSQTESWLVQVARVDANTVNVTFGHWTSDYVKTSVNDPPYTPKTSLSVKITTFRPPNTT